MHFYQNTEKPFMKHPQENNKKKKILFHTNHSKAFTGFGKNCRNILSYLYATDKYEIVEACNGMQKSNPSLSKLPWKCVGTLPDDQSRIDQINKDPNIARAASYGAEMIDELIKEVKPDIYIGAEDIWGFTDYWKKKWWNKINCMIWTTLDSLPILPTAVKMAPKIKNYYVWASFAEKALHALGHTHVKTLRGCIDPSNFYKLPHSHRIDLRRKNNIDKDSFIIGFVFRNQLRKSVPNLLDGFKLFLNQNPSSKAKLLLHTHWGEGWDILRLIKEKEINVQDVLTTYVCKRCKNYEIKPFSGPNLDCRFCGSKQSQDTTSIQVGVTEEALNEVYNLMDVYCHPFTSGGQEIPLQEAKLTELITLTTNYSCGEDNCTPESGGLPLDWTEYREPNTQFIKATTSPESILYMLEKVFNLSLEERNIEGIKARNFVINNFSSEVIGKQLEDIIIFSLYFYAPPRRGQDYTMMRYIELEKPENVAKMNERLGEWAGSKLGKSEEEKKNYIQEIIKSDLEEAGQEDVFRKIKKDFQAASIDIEETEIRDQMKKAFARAKEDFKK